MANARITATYTLPNTTVMFPIAYIRSGTDSELTAKYMQFCPDTPSTFLAAVQEQTPFKLTNVNITDTSRTNFLIIADTSTVSGWTTDTAALYELMRTTSKNLAIAIDPVTGTAYNEFSDWCESYKSENGITTTVTVE